MVDGLGIWERGEGSGWRVVDAPLWFVKGYVWGCWIYRDWRIAFDTRFIKYWFYDVVKEVLVTRGCNV